MLYFQTMLSQQIAFLRAAPIPNVVLAYSYWIFNYFPRKHFRTKLSYDLHLSKAQRQVMVQRNTDCI